jgi:hypothetical protein
MGGFGLFTPLCKIGVLSSYREIGSLDVSCSGGAGTRLILMKFYSLHVCASTEARRCPALDLCMYFRSRANKHQLPIYIHRGWDICYRDTLYFSKKSNSHR